MLNTETYRDKFFIIDTNTLIHDPSVLYAFQDDEEDKKRGIKRTVLVANAVIEELDILNHRDEDVKWMARKALRSIEDTIIKYEGIETDGNGDISRQGFKEGLQVSDSYSIQSSTDYDHKARQQLPEAFALKNRNRVDHHLLRLLKFLSKKYDAQIVTKDRALRIKAREHGLIARDWIGSRVHKVYKGWRKITSVPSELTKQFKREGYLTIEDLENIFQDPQPNEYFHLQSDTFERRGDDDTTMECFMRYDANTNQLVELLEFPKELDFTPSSPRQRFAVDALLNPNILVVYLMGWWGTGKTFLSTLAATKQILEDKLYNSLLVTRPMFKQKRDIGFLPGEEEDKMLPWLIPIYDNLEEAVGKFNNRINSLDMFKKKYIEIQRLDLAGGRTLKRKFWYVTEAHKILSKIELYEKVIARLEDDSKLIIDGDPWQDEERDPKSNPIIVASEEQKHRKETATIVFPREDIRRGKAPTMIAELAKKRE